MHSTYSHNAMRTYPQVPELSPRLADAMHTNSAGGFPFSQSSPTLVTCLFHNNHSDWEEISFCGFDLHFTDD